MNQSNTTLALLIVVILLALLKSGKLQRLVNVAFG